jgi:probable DNA repair protein
LDELAQLGPSLGKLGPAEAGRVFHDLAARTIFEPATGDVAVTLTDAFADPLARYDGVWVTGLHADVWPRPFHFDPFIPLALQRDAGIPATSAVDLLREARTLLGIWRRATPQLVLSWPRHGDDSEYLASPLLGELGELQPWPARESDPVLARATRGKVALETFDDAAGIAWPAGAALPAGTRSIEYQSRCPFRAYAELRLGCVPLDTPRHGVDPRARGRLLHRTLELLWMRLEDWQGLQAHDVARLTPLVEESVSRALQECFSEAQLREQGRALARERRRAQRLVLELCELERRRQPFRVRALEARRVLSLSGAALDVRIDRVDELADGSAVIFDYKSGRPQALDWLDERTANPQLLVYLHALDTPVSALVNAYLNSARVSYRGLADQKGRLPGVDALRAAATPTSVNAPMTDASAQQDSAWQGQVDRWRRHVEAVARDFLEGRAAVDPVEQACRTCHLHTFCRIADAERPPEGAALDD